MIARARATDWRDRPVELFNRVRPSSTGGLNSNMLFNWVQPLFNRYAQRCAKGVTRGVKSVSPPRCYPSLACRSGPPTPSSAAPQLAARSSQRSTAARSAAQRERRVREGSAGTGTPSSTSSLGRSARPHSQLQQPLPQPPADQHRPHSQSSATSPTSTTTPGPLHPEHRW